MDTGELAAILALVGVGIASFATYKSSKNATRVGLEANAFQRAVAAEKKASDADDKAENANRRLEACSRRLRVLESEIVTQESKLRYIIQMIHDPYTTIEFLRERVPTNFGIRRDE